MLDDVLEFALAPVRARRQLQALLMRADPEFVRCAYLSAAWREPTAREGAEALARLAAGASKITILTELLAARTDAAGRHGAWWLRHALGHERLARMPLLRPVAQMPLNPLPWLMRLVFKRFINEDPRAAFVLLESVTAREGGRPIRPSRALLTGCTRIYARRRSAKAARAADACRD